MNVTSELCDYCKYENVPKFINMTRNYVSDLVGNSDFRPFIATDSVAKMQVRELTIEMLLETYTKHPIMSSKLGGCLFQNNVGLENDFYDFFNSYGNELPEKWHASWLNCDAKAAKIIRKYHSRPYFLPAMMQLETENAIIVTK